MSAVVGVPDPSDAAEVAQGLRRAAARARADRRAGRGDARVTSARGWRATSARARSSSSTTLPMTTTGKIMRRELRRRGSMPFLHSRAGGNRGLLRRPCAFSPRRAADSAPRARRRWRRCPPAPRGDRAVDVDQRVGHLAARLVDHVVDVEPGLRHRGRDLAEHVGHVGVGDRHAVGRLARHRHLREVDRVGDVAVLEVVAQLVDDHHRAVVLGLARRRAQVRQRDHARVAVQRRRSGKSQTYWPSRLGGERGEHRGCRRPRLRARSSAAPRRAASGRCCRR